MSKSNYQVVKDQGVTWCKSYAVFVAKLEGNQITIDSRYLDYSATTSRHLGKFLGESKRIIRKKIATGEYKLERIEK